MTGNKRIRKTAEERKAEICEIAKEIILKKGFRNMTMDELIDAVGISKGGMYHHYKNTKDVLRDVVKRLNLKRYDNITEFISQNKEMSKEELIAEINFQKLLDESDEKKIYCQFLLEIDDDEELKELYNRIFEEGVEDFLVAIEKFGMPELKVLTYPVYHAFMKSIILGVELLGTREVFEQNPEFLKEITLNYIKKYNSENKD
ncbi:MAG: TetR/AcrR family transcriptional regulator [Tissierellia bacterium]|nr:TetR/AcrR family transcriptional regulator [Tissierellia bacterium]